VSLTSCTSTISNCNFTGLNTNHPNAVVILSQGDSNKANLTTSITTKRGALSVKSCRFVDNYAPQGNSIVFVHKQAASISDCLFQNNTLLVHGALVLSGADYLGSTSTINVAINNTRFLDNTSSRLGGAIFSDGAFRTTIDNCTFSGNRALRGAAISLVTQTSLYARQPVFITNTHFDFNAAGIYHDRHSHFVVVKRDSVLTVRACVDT
jgi:predicted outer membrane repeat protein